MNLEKYGKIFVQNLQKEYLHQELNLTLLKQFYNLVLSQFIIMMKN